MNKENDEVPDKEPMFDDETLEALREFGKVLRRIHDRLTREGKTIEIDDRYNQKNQS